MRKLRSILGAALFVATFCLPLGFLHAEDATFSQAELDQLVAPIALYPDALLAQILMASTYPAQVVEAVEWSEANPERDGDDAVESVQEKSWDPSVMSLVAFPQVMRMMGEQPDWVQRLGDAFLADSEAVMDAVQKLRKKAKEEGNLETTEQQTVVVEQPSSTETIIIVEPADPDVVYVPVYNPTVVYGAWWWPNYVPWYYYPSGYYGFGSAVIRGIGFGIGVGITNALWGGCRWGRGDIDIDINRYNRINVNRNRIGSGNQRAKWKHNPSNRRGTPYRDSKTRKRFADKRGGAEGRREFRGRDAQRDKARLALENRGVNLAGGRKELRGAGGNKVRDSVNRVNRDRTTGGLQRRDVSKAAESRRSRDLKSRQSRTRSHALSGSGNAKRSRKSISRGNTSHRSMANRGGGRGGRGRR